MLQCKLVINESSWCEAILRNCTTTNIAYKMMKFRWYNRLSVLQGPGLYYLDDNGTRLSGCMFTTCWLKGRHDSRGGLWTQKHKIQRYLLKQEECMEKLPETYSTTFWVFFVRRSDWGFSTWCCRSPVHPFGVECAASHLGLFYKQSAKGLITSSLYALWR